MSSTNRSNARDTHISDYYITPKAEILNFLDAWLYDLSNEQEYNLLAGRPDKALWLDPCSGGDKDHSMPYVQAIQDNLGASVMSIDIREDSGAETIGDYLTMEIVEPRPDVIISNPPFALAQEFITKALKDVARGGYVVMLLRLNFLESKARKQFFENNMPERIYVHHKRMSFTDDGKTDSVAYMHACWKQGTNLSKSILKII